MERARRFSAPMRLAKLKRRDSTYEQRSENASVCCRCLILLFYFSTLSFYIIIGGGNCKSAIVGQEVTVDYAPLGFSGYRRMAILATDGAFLLQYRRLAYPMYFSLVGRIQDAYVRNSRIAKSCQNEFYISSLASAWHH